MTAAVFTPVGLHTQAQQLLDVIAGELDAPPDRRYVAAGLPAVDCEQLTVHVTAFDRGTTNGQSFPDRQCGPTVVTAIVQQTWCISTVDNRGNPPPTDDVAADGDTVVAGGEALWLAVLAASRTVDCRPAVGPAVPIEPQGAYAGWQVTVQWPLG